MIFFLYLFDVLANVINMNKRHDGIEVMKQNICEHLVGAQLDKKHFRIRKLSRYQTRFI